MNEKSLKAVEDFFSSDRPIRSLREAFLEFLSRSPVNILNNLKNKIECIDMSDVVYKTYSIQDGAQKDILIEFGDIKDLNHHAIVGLVAHLFALININYHENIVPRGKEWLEIDLYSDEIAKQWGFVNEIKNLRKIRPQKLPDDVSYPDIVIDHSALNKKFNSDIQLISSRQDEFLLNDEKIWYVDKFSMICNLRHLRNDDIKYLHIITNKYTPKELEKYLKSNLAFLHIS